MIIIISQSTSPRSKRCQRLSSRTPLRSDPEALQRAKQLRLEPPLVEGIREIVTKLIANGIETFNHTKVAVHIVSQSRPFDLKDHRPEGCSAIGRAGKWPAGIKASADDRSRSSSR